jgi:hypothetical protein
MSTERILVYLIARPIDRLCMMTNPELKEKLTTEDWGYWVSEA